MIPQLRVRTEYNFRRTYGPVERVAERLAQLKCSAAGIVEPTGTWGHVAWEKALTKAGVTPMYGTEVDGYWVLATNLRQFYRFSSNPTDEALAAGKGLIRFAGAALTNPDLFDYIDINPRSRRRTATALALARKTKKPLIVTSDNDYPAPEDRERFLGWNDAEKMTPQFIASEEVLRAAMSYVPEATWKRAARSTREVAERIGCLKLRKAPLIFVAGDLGALVAKGKRYRLRRGHIASWTKEYADRLRRELEMIRVKSFESYFLVVADMIVWAKDRMLVGPARGSSAGSLVCYLLRITEVDPLIHGLLFERFIDINRSDLPDIDVDFNDHKREQVFAYLREKYGEENVARIGSVNRLKPRSVMAHVGKKLGIPHGATFGVLNVLIEYSSGDRRYGKGLEDTLENTAPGRKFLAQYPEASLIAELENHASHSGVHAGGVIVSNRPTTEYCTVRDGVAQIDKKDAEYLELLKIDVLGLRTLGVIEDTRMITPQQLYDLKLTDKKVFAIYNQRKFSGVFQFEGEAQRRVAVQIPIKSFTQLDHITALARPGPLGGGAADSYINRNAGREPTTYRHPSMKEYLADTMGVVLYQEQVMRIVRELGEFSWEDTSVIREAMSASKGEEFFDRLGKRFAKGAANHGISRELAITIWKEIVSFGAWGMNRSHTVSYAIISYWCAYMKRYHPLEYAAALLRNAKDDEQVIEMLRELQAEGVGYIPFDPDLSSIDWDVISGNLVGGFTNLVGIGPVKARYYVTKRDTEGLTEKDLEKLAKLKVKHDDLRPAHTLWSNIYEHPDDYNIHGRAKEFAELRDDESAVVVAQLVRLERRDENENIRVNKRGYKKDGQTLFLDCFMVDDSMSKAVRVRLRPRMWEGYGEPLADRAVARSDWFLIRGRWLEKFSMMIVQKIKCLTNEEMFE